MGKNTLEDALEKLDAELTDPGQGLPEEVFLFTSRVTPMVNVDLLIRNERGEVLLTWRGGDYYVPGWHVPGGIIRYKESLYARLEKVAWLELGATITYQKKPLAVKEIIRSPERKNRGHFITFLFNCSLKSNPSEDLLHISGDPVSGSWKWHSRCPDDIIPVHRMYKEIINENKVTEYCKSDFGISRSII